MNRRKKQDNNRIDSIVAYAPNCHCGVRFHKMKYYEEFKSYGHSFAERVGDPDEFTSGIGRIAINFAELEEALRKAIGKLLTTDSETGEIVAAELSFRAKVNLFASLVRKRANESSLFNVGYAPLLGVLDELCANCFKAEELRNTIMHSSWLGPYHRDAEATRRKPSAKAKHGFRVVEETVDSAYLLDIADFTICVAEDVEEFFYIS